MYDAIVLAGGSARRLGGVDKPGLDVGAGTLLDRVLNAVPDADRTVVAGPPRPVRRDVVRCREVMWCREDPPGGGPVAAIAAALPHTRAATVLVLAADLPGLGPAVPLLLDALRGSDSDPDVALLVDPAGRANHLAAAWRRTALERALAGVGAVRGAAVRELLRAARVERVADTGGWGLDCDTWADVDAARRALAPEPSAPPAAPVTDADLDAWVTELAAALDVPVDAVDRDLLLDVARDAAHGIARPAAPLTTFLVGLAAGLRGGDAAAVRTAAATAQRLAARADEGRGQATSSSPA